MRVRLPVPFVSSLLGSDTVAAAVAARDAALSAGNMYADTTAGLAATSDGGYFTVPSAEVGESFILYQNQTGAAVEQKRFPAGNVPGIRVAGDNDAAHGFNLVANTEVNSIASDVHSSTIAGGGMDGFVHVIGTKAGTNADYATISGGYDNRNDQQAGTISGGAHHFLDSSNGGDHGTIGGGSYNKIDGTGPYSTISGGTQNSVTGAGGSATIGGGQQNTASEAGATVGGGTINSAGGNSSTIAGGSQNTIASGATGSAVIGGVANSIEAAAQYATARGRRGKASLPHQHVTGGSIFSAVGDAQAWEAVIKAQSTSSASTSITLDGVVMSLPDNTTWAFTILLVARCAATAESAAYEFKGCIKRGVGAASAALVGSVTKTVLGESVAAWDANVTADTTGGDLRVRGTGETSKTINWVGHVRVSSVTA